MFAVFLTSEYAPFAIAFLVMIGIGLIEAIGLGLGQFDLHVDMDGGDGAEIGALDWIGLRRGVPILVWLIALLGCFTLAGIIIQQIATGLIGAPIHWGLASVAALLASGIANRFAAAGLAHLLPEYESTVIDTDDLLLRRGLVLDGPAIRGHPTRAKVLDHHGQAHYVMIEPHHDDDIIPPGSNALLVRRHGALFFVQPDEPTQLRPI